ncbi:MAG: HEAT repeat domain-containing protein [Candidatus Brocadiia bacterium]
MRMVVLVLFLLCVVAFASCSHTAAPDRTDTPGISNTPCLSNTPGISITPGTSVTPAAPQTSALKDIVRMTYYGKEDWWNANNGHLLNVLPSEERSYLTALDPQKDVPRLLTISVYRGLFDKGVQEIAFDALRGMGDKAVDVLISIIDRKYTFAVDTKHPWLNEDQYADAAIRALGYIGGAGAQQVAIRKLAEKSFSDRFWVCDALGRIGNQASLPLLEKVLTTDSDRSVRSAAAEAIARIGGMSAVAALQKGFAEAKEFPEARAFIAASIGYIGAHDASEAARAAASAPESVIWAALADESFKVRCAAVVALGQMNRPELLDAVLSTIEKDGNYLVRDHACAALACVSIPPTDVERVVNALVKAAKTDKEFFVRGHAAYMLSMFKDNAAAFAAVRGVLSDKSSDVQAMAAYSLGLLGNHEGGMDLKALLQKGKGTPRAYAARIGLGLLGDEANIPDLVDEFADLNQTQELDSAAFAIAKCATPDTYADVLKFMDNEDIYIREYGIKCLGMMRNLTDETRAKIITKLAEREADEDGTIRFFAAVVRYAMGDRKALPIALSALYVENFQFIDGTVVDSDNRTYMAELTGIVNDTMPLMYRVKPYYWPAAED